MAIFRGIGGAGDSNTDATLTAVTEQAVNAANSATNAASSASSAASSAADAATSETNAAASAVNAATSETNAAASESAAAASETAAAASETAAAASEAAAASSETNAAASEAAAGVSETAAAASEAAAAVSEANAASSASAASTSAGVAALNAASASASASSASTSASNAATSETNAAASEAAAAVSEANAAASAASAASSDFAGFQSGGTANGVAYLNGSKVLTSGSALTFDGTNLGIGNSNPTEKLEVVSTSGAVTARIWSATNTSPIASLEFQRGTNATWGADAYGDYRIRNETGALLFQYGENGSTSEKMRLTSTGLGIGTSSPTNTLSVAGNANITGNTTLGDASTDTVQVNGYMGVGGAGTAGNGVLVTSSALTTSTQTGVWSSPIGTSSAISSVNSFMAQPQTAAASFTSDSVYGFRALNATKGAGSTITNQHGVHIADQTQGTNNYGITSAVSSGTNKWNIYASGTAANYFAGNIGLGVTPSAWGTSYSGVLQLASNKSIAFAGNQGTFWTNAYIDSVGQARYVTTAASASYFQDAGAHKWYTAPSGTAGNAITFTEKARIDSDGLKFNGDTAADNALDDYEEGAWTPTYSPATAFTGITYDTAITAGKYTKIGNLVVCAFNIRTSSISGGAGQVKLGGLPFTAATVVSYAVGGGAIVEAGSVGAFAGDVPSSVSVIETTTTASITYRATANGNTAALDVTDLATGAAANFLYGTFFYYV